MHIHLKVMFAMCRVLLERTLVFATQTSQLFVVPPQQISMFLEDHFVINVFLKYVLRTRKSIDYCKKYKEKSFVKKEFNNCRPIWFIGPTRKFKLCDISTITGHLIYSHFAIPGQGSVFIRVLIVSSKM